MANSRMAVTAFEIPGYETPDALPIAEASDQKAVPYAIAPAIWMILFLFIGYIGIRMLLED